jgi:hypothetical protein
VDRRSAFSCGGTCLAYKISVERLHGVVDVADSISEVAVHNNDLVSANLPVTNCR